MSLITRVVGDRLFDETGQEFVFDVRKAARFDELRDELTATLDPYKLPHEHQTLFVSADLKTCVMEYTDDKNPGRNGLTTYALEEAVKWLLENANGENGYRDAALKIRIRNRLP